MMSIDEATKALIVPGGVFELTEVEVDRRPYRVWKLAPPTLRAVLDGTTAYADRVYIVFEGERLTFAEHLHRVSHVARWLVEDQGVQKGDRVAIAMRNLPEFAIAFWAAIAAGAVVVLLNGWWTGPELAYGLSDSGARVLFADGERALRLRPQLPGLGLQTVVVARDETLGPGHVGFADLVKSDAEIALPEVDLLPEDPATILYTGGTTAHPKGALGTHRNATVNILGLAFVSVHAALRHTGSVPVPDPAAQEAMLVVMPMFHVSGLYSIILTAAFGSKAVLMSKWDADRALALVEQERITITGGVPTMMWQMLESPELPRRDLSSLRSVGMTGSAVLPDLLRRLDEHIPGRTLTNGYGLTETWGLVTVNTGGDYTAKPDSVGRPLPTNDIKLVAEDGTEVAAAGQVGELWVRSPGLIMGYWNQPEASAEAITDGWFHTGDIARVDDEGFVYVVDRVKDMVIRGGENVYCVEVEAVLTEHPAVAEAAVIGIPHDVLGEEVGAIVHLEPGATATEDELRAYVAERLAAFKVPTSIWLRSDPLPVSAIGKVLKQQLRNEYSPAPTAPST